MLVQDISPSFVLDLMQLEAEIEMHRASAILLCFSSGLNFPQFRFTIMENWCRMVNKLPMLVDPSGLVPLHVSILSHFWPRKIPRRPLLADCCEIQAPAFYQCKFFGNPRDSWW